MQPRLAVWEGVALGLVLSGAGAAMPQATSLIGDSPGAVVQEDRPGQGASGTGAAAAARGAGAAAVVVAAGGGAVAAAVLARGLLAHQLEVLVLPLVLCRGKVRLLLVQQGGWLLPSLAEGREEECGSRAVGAAGTPQEVQEGAGTLREGLLLLQRGVGPAVPLQGMSAAHRDSPARDRGRTRGQGM